MPVPFAVPKRVEGECAFLWDGYCDRNTICIRTSSQTAARNVSKLFRNVPLLTSLEVSPFRLLVLAWLRTVLVRSGALLSPKGVAFRAERRTRTVFRRSPSVSPSAQIRGGLLGSTGVSLAGSTFSSCSLHAVSAEDSAGKRVRVFPPTVGLCHGIR